jgi:hypothetical protein
MIIEDLQEKSTLLKDNAEFLAVKLEEEGRQKEIEENIKILTRKKMEFKQESMKRSNSFCSPYEPLLDKTSDQELFRKLVGDPADKPHSRGFDRENLLKAPNDQKRSRRNSAMSVNEFQDDAKSNSKNTMRDGLNFENMPPQVANLLKGLM